MRNLLRIVALTATLLVGCSNAPNEITPTSAAARQPAAATSTAEAPASPPAPQISVLTATNNCKNDWVNKVAKERGITAAAAEGYARTLPVGTMVNGKPLALNETVWSTCEASIVASRAAPAAAAPARAVPAAAPTQAQYNTLLREHEQLKLAHRTLRGEAYLNPLEKDGSKLRSYRAHATDLEGQLAEKEWPKTMLGLALGLGVVLGGIAIYLYQRPLIKRLRKQLNGRHAGLMGGV